MKTHALVSLPAANFADGIKGEELGDPDYKLALYQHKSYCDLLQSVGITIEYVVHKSNLPDGCFVEDIAIVIGDLAIITNPTRTRKPERAAVAKKLSAFVKVVEPKWPGGIDGGDVLQIGKHFYVGLTERTTQPAFELFAEVVMSQGYSASLHAVPTGTLHFKTGATYLGNGFVVAIKPMAGIFLDDFEVLVVPEQEAYSANCLLVNDKLIIPKGYNLSKKQMLDQGLHLIEADMSEFKKMNGGLTCLSILL